MKTYRSAFKPYFAALARRAPAPGGGSALCLFFCTAACVIEKAIRYSLSHTGYHADRGVTKKFNVSLKRMSLLRAKAYRYIDKDSLLFEKSMISSGEARAAYIAKSEALVVDLAGMAHDAFSLAKQIESGIKKSMRSDFTIGLLALRVVFAGCVLNLEANALMFSQKNASLYRLKKELLAWPLF
jgi:formiminotetrahydrofolate cyclodeaminase